MCAVATPKHKWPPAPRVEDERVARSYEVSDSSLSSYIEDDDSVVSRGTIDQWPIILPVESPGPCNQSAHHDENIMSRKNAAAKDMPIYRKATDNTLHTSSLKRSQSERRPTSKVRFSEPPGRDEHSRVRMGPVPSKANMKYSTEPEATANATGKDAMSSQKSNSSSKSHRKSVIQGPEGPRSQGANYSLGYTSQQKVSSHPAATSKKYSADELDNRSDFSDAWESVQRLDISSDGGDRRPHRRQHAGEWYSDDEVFSSHRSSHKSRYSPPAADESVRKESQDTKTSRRSRKDDTMEPAPRQRGSSRRRKPMATEEMYSYISETSSGKGKNSSRSERRRSNSSLPRLERANLESCANKYQDTTDEHFSEPMPKLPATTTAPPYDGALTQQQAFAPVTFVPSGQDYNPEGWEYISPAPCYECTGHDAGWSTTPYLPAVDMPLQPPYLGYQDNTMSNAPALSSTLAGQEIPSRGAVKPHRQVSPRRRCEETPALAPCPRSIAMADYNDWSTIVGLTHMNICPSCTQQIKKTRFDKLVIPAPPQPLGLPVRCSMSQPWARLAWVQTMKLGLNHLELLYQLTRPSSIYKGCPGRTPSTQTWYRVIDPDTGRLMPNFNACASCFRNVRILMPSLRDSFQPSSTSQERTCDLRCGSTRFIQYLDLLDVAATRHRHDPGHKPDLRDFIRYAKRKNRIYDCPRDHLIVGPWHGIDELPEFTVCEDCYDDVVWPFGNSPVASLVSPTVQMTPDRAGPASRQASCQLYSPRMRMMFREAVRRSDFGYLRAAVLARYQAENAFRENKRLLMEDVSLGYDRDAELRKNAAEWRRWE
ncbi:hypothetical protein H112_03765 [Trichophyton rubrum D6]|uniref:Uncharacterized protein n=2 Tax=Trichophyton rubrum TaxID=5551 RepID=A0A178EX52_TRIRU|nr:hypothetical protein H100_03774 [Trichophyton rubrum MR850]EZF42472.1 hypothetical protein H102_03762 [Trichophyton rubrum CBS 100081]EZF53084.1 hypothetical protein H103_03775 [Trichophyton rubrum CBS 288.86]EZF63757.1 hypothetical protein H104_03761 [Trichophyton rubrum CBS 289.86]EZF85032.1 hypothetical protein H110_03767 [Trichophyton rubrum MR1448]EZF95870.1 hypothetical protein H113_03799 [Trichophyton rubrum MR1459]EZG17391.1 hypothetical protein H107_03884 [Trichophyton rubrum CBS 